jgi:hypothetical protein
MGRGKRERVRGAAQRHAWFARTAPQQDTRPLLFSTVSDVLRPVVLRLTPSVRAAYRDGADEGGASLMAVYHKHQGLATHPAAALVRSRAAVVTPLMAPLDGARGSW